MGKERFVMGRDQTRQKQTKFNLKMMTGKEDDFGKSKKSYMVHEKNEERSSKKRKKEMLKIENYGSYTLVQYKNGLYIPCW